MVKQYRRTEQASERKFLVTVILVVDWLKLTNQAGYSILTDCSYGFKKT